MSEHTEQVTLMNWCKLMERSYPQLALIFSIPNGGKRHIGTARKLKAEGVKSGVPDIFLSVAKNGKHGLYIELKGYEAKVCYGFGEAKKVICDYMGIE